MDTEKELEMIEEVRRLVKLMAKDAFEESKKHGEELSPVVVIAVEGEPSLAIMDGIAKLFRTMVFDKDGCVLIVIDVDKLFQSTEGKDLCAGMIRVLVEKLNAFYAGLVSESWMAKYKKDEKRVVKPSESPDRQEVVTIMDSTRHTSSYSMSSITRMKGEDNHFREMGEWEDLLADKRYDGMKGRFTGFFGDTPGSAKA